MPPDYDMITGIIDYEDGHLNEEGKRALFQHLVDTGYAWRLQGHYGRMAAHLIRAGVVEGKIPGEDS